MGLVLKAGAEDSSAQANLSSHLQVPPAPPDEKAVAPYDDTDPNATPFCILRAEFLREHNDEIMAISYLRRIVKNGSLIPAHRAQAIVELADCLQSQNQPGEALYWLKIWMGQYSGRPETGAISNRIGTLYAAMQLPDLARDAYYDSLSATVNQAQVKDANDLQLYSSLTQSTLWSLAENEFENQKWDRAAELYARYLKEADTAPKITLERAEFREGDCAFLKNHWDEAEKQYQEALAKYPFNPVAPEVRLRLYEILMTKNEKELAGQELVALMWTVKTAWPAYESYWQKRTGEVLLKMNANDPTVLQSLVQQMTHFSANEEDKHWQEVLNHYDTLCSLQTGSTPNEANDNLKGTGQESPINDEQVRLEKLDHYLNRILPDTIESTPQT